MNNSWKMKCSDVKSFNYYTKDKIYNVINGMFTCDDGYTFPYYENFEEWSHDSGLNWELIEELEPLTAEEVIELFKEILFDADRSACKLYFNDRYFNVSAVFNDFTPKDIIERLTKYRDSKIIHTVSMDEWNKVASDELDRLYPNGWKREGECE